MVLAVAVLVPDAGAFVDRLKDERESGAPVFIVNREISGDTLLLNTGRIVHLIGVLVPSEDNDELNAIIAEKYGFPLEDVRRYGREAREFVKSLVHNQKVFFEIDPRNEAVKHRTPDDQALVYAWFTAPIYHEFPDWMVLRPDAEMYDAFLNAILIKSGMAVVDLTTTSIYAEEFPKLQAFAAEKRLGLWSTLPEEKGEEKTEIPSGRSGTQKKGFFSFLPS